MVAIPQRSDPTLDALKSFCEQAQNRERRDYLGASSIGHECSRKVWYGFYKPELAKPMSWKSLWAIEDGHRTESLIASRLQAMDGIELITEKNGKQIRFEALDGRFCGHVDGLIRGLLQAPAKWHVWECKATNEKRFAEFQKCKLRMGEKAALKDWNLTYFVQAQIYMHYLNIDRHYLTVSSSGGRDIDSCRTEYEPHEAEKYIRRAKEILTSPDQPPDRISLDPKFFICNMCDFKEHCHNEDASPVPERSRRCPF